MPKKKATAYAFLDTNLYLQFRDFDQIDWPSVLGYENVCLVVAPITFSELDHFKYDQTSDRRRRRSRAITTKINILLFSAPAGADVPVPDRPSVTLRVLTDSPDMASYPGLQPTVSDDQLLASILKFSGGNAAVDPQDVILVSEDGGLLNKARARRVAIHSISEQFRLADESTTGEKRIAFLEKKLAQLENNQPKLSLAFVDDNYPVESLRFLTVALPVLTQEEISQRCEIEARAIAWSPPGHSERRDVTRQERQENDPWRSLADVLETTANSWKALEAFSLAAFPQEEIDRYEKEKTEYLDAYRQHICRLHNWRQVTQRTRQIVTAIINEGSVPATGVVAQLVFPDDLKVVDMENSPKQPKGLVRPQKPMTAMERLAPASISTPYMGDLLRRITTPVVPDTSGPKITPFNGTRVEWERKKVTHHLPLHLTPLSVVFPPRAEEQSFSVAYKLFADNLATPVEGTLTICVSPSQRA